MKRFSIGAAMAVAVALSVGLTACENDAKTVSHNLSQAADSFKIMRRIVFYNSMTDTYMFTVEGLCSLDNAQTGHNSISVTCKIGNDEYVKHFLGLSSTVTFFSVQLEAKNVSAFHHVITFKPQAILPDIDYRGSAKELTTNRNSGG